MRDSELRWGMVPSPFGWWMASVVLFSLVAGAKVACADEPSEVPLQRVDITALRRHCATLAADSLEGREAGTSGGRAAAAYLQTELQRIPGIVPGTGAGWMQEFGANYRNVLAQLPGTQGVPAEYVLIGAHYDHIGRGSSASSLGGIGQIHNGADDNASGTAALLELIRVLAERKNPLKRTLIFAFWDAEESGLKGSRHWMSNPTVPRDRLRIALNLDMLGRVRERTVHVTGWRTSPGLRSRIARHNSHRDFQIGFPPTVRGDSDHHTFYAAGIPCLHFDSGLHDDYHRPTDDADKVNLAGLQSATELICDVILDLASEPALPAFRREVWDEKPPAWLTASKAPVPSPRLGVTFEIDAFARDEAIVANVAEGSAAARAGIRPGDRIVGLAHWDGKLAADLRTIVQVAQNPVMVVVQRPGEAEPIRYAVDLAGTPVRIGMGWELDPVLPECAVVTRVVAQSPADRAGLIPGDIVMRVNGEAVSAETDFRRRLQELPGPLDFEVEHAGKITRRRIDLFDR